MPPVRNATSQATHPTRSSLLLSRGRLVIQGEVVGDVARTSVTMATSKSFVKGFGRTRRAPDCRASSKYSRGPCPPPPDIAIIFTSGMATRPNSWTPSRPLAPRLRRRGVGGTVKTLTAAIHARVSTFDQRSGESARRPSAARRRSSRLRLRRRSFERLAPAPTGR
jgi:hypothetical protein